MGGTIKGGGGKEITQIPMCLNCAVACGNEDGNALVERAMRRVDLVDGGLSRALWYAATTYNSKSKSRGISQIRRPRATTMIANRQSLLGGDSSMDIVSSPPPDIPHSPIVTAPPSPNREGTGDEEDEDTLARLHYRRYRANPRFAKLECVVPVDAALYVSIFDPMGSPAFRPRPAKPLPKWMRLLPRTHELGRKNDKEGDCLEKNCPDQDMEEVEECYPSPRSVLDVHFPPASTFRARQLVDNGVRETPENPMNDIVRESAVNEKRVGMTYPDARPPLRFACLTPPLMPPPRSGAISPSPGPAPILKPAPPRRSYDREANESVNSDLSEELSQCQSEGADEEMLNNDSRRYSSPQSESGYIDIKPDPTALRPTQTPHKRPSIVSDEPLQQPSSRLGGVGLRSAYAGISKDKETSSIIEADNTGKTTPRRNSKSLNPILQDNEQESARRKIGGDKEKGKRKTVVWHDSVEGGETESERCDSEESHDSCLEMLDRGCEGQKNDSTQDINTQHDKSDWEAEITNTAEEKLYPEKADTCLECAPNRSPSSPMSKPTLSKYRQDADADDDKAGALWRRVIRAQTPTAQSSEFLDLYRSRYLTRRNDPYKTETETVRDNDPCKKAETGKEEIRFAHPSLAMPGRRREREIGIGLGNLGGIHVGVGGGSGKSGVMEKMCPTCGNTTRE
ncbi:hypothetical protein F5B22DRAFT_2419 [Xylaria bambusicola]|uniref:uncharacterized protein n=1 Tax=Xylaria bambusicola TaxID=326684 RepID=UPI002007FFB6|nr:uncharacterized protein F5B22DRAFT_2419 [Xylaria bambusicola]KAI0527744.1 hypothetical protein F5B22DRAFT_2419 [Xylaria bambusicola]